MKLTFSWYLILESSVSSEFIYNLLNNSLWKYVRGLSIEDVQTLGKLKNARGSIFNKNNLNKVDLIFIEVIWLKTFNIVILNYLNSFQEEKHKNSYYMND